MEDVGGKSGRALAAVTLGNIDVAVRRKRQIGGVEEQTLPRRFVPEPGRAALTNPHHHFAPRIHLDDHVAALIAEPDVVVGVDADRMRAHGDVLAKPADELLVGVELQHLRLAGGGTVEHEDMSLGIHGNAADLPGKGDIRRQRQGIDVVAIPEIRPRRQCVHSRRPRAATCRLTGR